MAKLNGKVALVTGADRGIGQATAQLFAEEGAKVAVFCRTDAKAEAAAAEINAAGGEAKGYGCDTYDLARIDECVKAVLRDFGGVDILVNNAHDTENNRFPLMEMPEEVIVKQFYSGPVQALRFMRGCYPSMVARGGGSIINMASGSGVKNRKNHAAYAMSKEALRSLTRTAAIEWGEHGIRVNNVCPVAVTEPFKAAVKAGFPAEPDTPIPRYGDAKEDVAPVILFLAGDDSKYMTGYTLMVDGGMFIDTAR